ncbi:MAG: zinc-ribbon domain-containing protein [Eggerthellaceae bacterium]|nr:zinc-ribbon domain-containing protein [Eggerthellaceae bacterium]
MYCPKCGSEVPANAAYCGKCGAKLLSAHGAANSSKAAAGVASQQADSVSARPASSLAGIISLATTFLLSLPKAALAAIVAAVVVAGGAGVIAVAIPHGDIPNGTYSATYGTTSIGQGGTVEVWGSNMSIKHIAGSVYDTDMSPYRISGNKLYYEPTEDDFFWISRFYTSTNSGSIVFDYRKSGNDIVLDGVTYYRK